MSALPAGTDHDASDSERDELAAIWDQYRDLILEQVADLERAVGALIRGALSEPLRAEAERSAHKLAGALGTFGFDTGSDNTREMELIFRDKPGPTRAPLLSELLAGLHHDLDSESRQPDLPAAASPSTSRWIDAPRILIVDADEEVAEGLVAEATRRGIAARAATTPAAARELVVNRVHDAVLLDLAFPGGAELLSALTSRSAPVPVFVMTDQDVFTDRMDAARRGATGFLPKSLPPRDAIDHVAQILERRRASGTRVLAVDDDPLILGAVQTLLEREGLAVTTLEDPLSFWEELERVAPTLVLLDFDMPGATGLELCRTLRNDPRWAAVPVLFLTARRDPASVHNVFAAGADDYMLKPIIGAELVTRINNRLDRFRLHQALAETDGLTGVANRRFSRDSLGRLIRMAGRFEQPLCLAELDLDYFKAVNDRYGHSAGDAVLRRFGSLLLKSFRGEDVVARWGGEEFVVGMYGMTREDGLRRIAGLLEAFRAEEFVAGGERFGVTFSAGVAQFPDDGDDVERLYAVADRALYEAKSAGRDRVVAGEPSRV